MILVTRPRNLAVETASSFKALGYNVLILPMLHISYMYKELADHDYAFVIMTSQNAVHASKHLDWLKKKKIYAVGFKTGELLKKIGCKDVSICSESKQNSDGLLDLIRNSEINPSNCLYLSGAEVTGDLEGEMRKLGYATTREIVYKSTLTTQLSESVINSINTSVSAVLFYSPRTALAFSKLIDKYQLNTSRKTAFCISQKTADILNNEAWGSILVSQNSSESSLLELVNSECAK